MDNILNMKNQKNFFVLLFIIFLVIFNSIIGSNFIDLVDRIAISTDETRHISAARSFQDGRNFELDYVPGGEFTLDKTIELYPPEISKPFQRPITYHAFLGSFFSESESVSRFSK